MDFTNVYDLVLLGLVVMAVVVWVRVIVKSVSK